MIAIIVPAHNEQDYLAACLKSLIEARRHAALRTRECMIVVVLDACTDRSLQIAREFDVSVLECDVRAVGAARALGANYAIAQGATWLASTDADTCVAPDWLHVQTSFDADAVCGTVAVDWPAHADIGRRDFEKNYVDADGHSHIHGANLGITTAAYLEAGGFINSTCHEDVALVQRLAKLGKRIAWTAAPRVITSGRTLGRAPCGFAAAIQLAITAG